MYRLMVFAFVIGAVVCQQQEGGRRVPKYAGDPKTAAILQEARYLSGNGAFGAAYQQEDGIDFKEETDPDGNRRGSYSYIDPTGQRKTVNYVAGKNGFQASGDHIPTAPQPVAPTPGYTPDPRYNSPDYKAPQYNAPQQYVAPAAPRNYGGKPSVDDGQYHPELYETENYGNSQPQYQSQAQYQAPQPQYQPQAQPQYQPQAQPQYQPQSQFQANTIYPGVQQAQYSGLSSQQYDNSAYQPETRQQYYEPTTPPPSRFFPPGKFSLNRAPDGYTYSFHKV
ncbi:PREDICTED: DNA translocase FtsK [Papilio xuthus]|uniref:DNA translocase FtsK n=1 Tax=Papilio xuthus TaxID=66420 RepID=A0AAJ7EDF8_PAPXU|nr:PREDICTED: DNA translocase FtsK [Papilio xuthus]